MMNGSAEAGRDAIGDLVAHLGWFGKVVNGTVSLTDPETGLLSDEAIGRSFNLAGFGLTGGLVGTEVRAGQTVLGAGPVRTASLEPDLALTAFDGAFATQQLLGTLTTPRGRQIMFHAADRMVNAPRGRLPMTPAEVDRVLEGATRIVKRSDHPQGSTLTIENANMPGRSRVIVVEMTGNRIITATNTRINNEIRELEGRIAQFVTGEDTSLELANIIEYALDDNYPHDDQVQKTVEMLAMYRPSGGDFLFDTPTIQERLSETMKYLRRLN